MLGLSQGVLSTNTRRYVLAACGVVVATLGMLSVREHLGVLNVLLIYLLVVFALALTTGAGPAAAMAIVSFVLFDFLFIPPYYTLTIANPDHVLTVFVYLGVAIITAQLVARVRARTEVAVREQRRTAMLYDLNAALISDVTVDQILTTIVEQVVHVYGAAACRILLPLPPDYRLTIRAKYPEDLDIPLDRQMQTIAGRALSARTPLGLGQHGRKIVVPTGMRTEAIRHKGARGDVLYVPIVTRERSVGVLEVHSRPGSGRRDVDAEEVLTSFANQAALALERARLTELAAEAAALAQSDELKSALLSAVSHDLRTPLAVIKAAATSLLDSGVEWSKDERHEFATAINEETDRLTLMVSNLLDLSRIEGGVLKPDREWYDGAELIEDVVDRLEPRATITNHAITMEVDPDLPVLYHSRSSWNRRSPAVTKPCATRGPRARRR